MLDGIRHGDIGLAEFASFAVELASAARVQTLQSLSPNVLVDDKGTDGLFDPVTNADRAAEAAMRVLIGERHPDHGIRGEEFPDKAGNRPFAWSLDPIDGTRSYICGLPTWTTLIALLLDEDPVLGLIDAPRLDETWIGTAAGTVMMRHGEQRSVTTTGCKNIAEARFSTTDPFLFGAAGGRLHPILRAVRVTRFGHDAYAYARLAAGDIDLVIECGLKPHDYCALVPVVRGAGGHFGDWCGGNDFRGGNVIAAASRELYDVAVELFAAK